MPYYCYSSSTPAPAPTSSSWVFTSNLNDVPVGMNLTGASSNYPTSYGSLSDHSSTSISGTNSYLHVMYDFTDTALPAYAGVYVSAAPAPTTVFSFQNWNGSAWNAVFGQSAGTGATLATLPGTGLTANRYWLVSFVPNNTSSPLTVTDCRWFDSDGCEISENPPGYLLNSGGSPSSGTNYPTAFTRTQLLWDHKRNQSCGTTTNTYGTNFDGSTRGNTSISPSSNSAFIVYDYSLNNSGSGVTPAYYGYDINSSGGEGVEVYYSSTGAGGSWTSLGVGLNGTGGVEVQHRSAMNSRAIQAKYWAVALASCDLGIYDFRFFDSSGNQLLPTSGAVVTLPSTPTNLSYGLIIGRQIAFSWDATTGAVSYKLLYGATVGTATANTAGTPTTNSLNFTPPDDSLYFYTVEAVNAGGTSSPSNIQPASSRRR